MFRRGGRSASETQVETRDSSSLSRRRFLTIPAAVTAFAGSTSAFAGNPLALRRSGSEYELAFAGSTWRFDAKGFGPSGTARLIVRQELTQLVLPDARLGGQRIGAIVLKLDARSRTVAVQVSHWGLRSHPIAFQEFLRNGALMEGRSADFAASRLARRFGWRLHGRSQLKLLPHGDWQISSANKMTRNTLSARQGVLRNLAPDRIPFLDWLEHRPRGWAGVFDVENAFAGEEQRWGNASARLWLNPMSIDRVQSVCLAGGQAYQATSGSWIARLQDGRRKWGAIHTEGGTLIEGRRYGVDHLLAQLPVAPVAHRITTPDGSARISGSRPHHMVFAAFSSNTSDEVCLTCRVECIPIGVPGSDFSEVVFEKEQDYTSAYSEHPRSPDSLSTLIYSTGLWGRWYIPMDKARLRIVRARDLLDLNIRFDQVALVRRWSNWRLEPIDQKDPQRPAAMSVEFPGQHVLEQAVFAQDPPPPQSFFSKPPASQAMSQAYAVPIDEDRLPPGELEAARAKRDPDYQQPGDDVIPKLAEARLSGRSQLAFQLPAPIGRRPHYSVPFTVQGLTDWTKLELRVVDSARTFFDEGNASAERSLFPLTDPYMIADAHFPDPPKSIDDRIELVTGRVVTSVDQHVFDTYIEIPARLWLSPDQTSIFETGPQSLGASPWGVSAHPLWHARLRKERPADPVRARRWTPPAVRAIGSPDFRQEFFTENEPLAQSHDVPWGGQLRVALTIRDRHELVSLSSLHGLPVLPRRTNEKRIASPSTVNDVSDKLSGAGLTGPIPASADTPAQKVRQRWLIDGVTAENQGVYAPPDIPVSDLRLSALGGFLDLKGNFEPPAPPYKTNKFGALTIESWAQSTTLGRDRFVEVVYKGFLFPIGHRASLVKRTERRFIPVKGRGEVAFLIQRYFIRINNPRKEFPSLNQPNNSNEFQVGAVTFTKTQTPDLRDPTFVGGTLDPDYRTFPGGKINLGRAQRGEVFWPRLNDNVGNEYNFEMELEGQEGEMTMPLMFLDNTAAHDPTTVKLAVEYYRGLHPEFRLPVNLTVANHKGAMRRYAPAADQRATTFATSTWIMDVQGRGDTGEDERYAINPAMEGKDQPPFYPRIHRAHVDIATVQRFSGRSSRLAVVSYDPLYTKGGFGKINPSELFLAVHGSIPRREEGEYSRKLKPVRMVMNGTGDRSGGVAHPNITLVNLSRLIGPVGGQSPAPRPSYKPAAASILALARSDSAAIPGSSARHGVFNSDFLPEDATLLGIIKLRDVIKAAGMAAAPQLLETVDRAAEDVAEQVAPLLNQINKMIRQWSMGDPIGSLLDNVLQVETPLGLVSKLYPGLASARRQWTAAQTQLAELNQSQEDQFQLLLDSVKALREYNEAIESLIDEIEMTGRDPIPSELTDLFRAINGGADGLLTAVRERVYETLTTAIVDQATLLFDPAIEQSARLWFASTFGPDAYDRLQTVVKRVQSAQKVDWDEVLSELVSSASDALLYELSGRPLLKVASKVHELRKELQTKVNDQGERLWHAKLDARRLVQELREVVELSLDALATEAEARLANLACGSATIQQFISALKGLFGTGGDLCIDDALARGMQAEFEKAMSHFDAIENTITQDFDDEPQRSQALTFVTRARAKLGNAYDQFNQRLDSLVKEQGNLNDMVDRLSAGSCSVAEFETAIGAISRWASLRGGLNGACIRVLGDLEQAIDDLPAPVSQAAQARVMVSAVDEDPFDLIGQGIARVSAQAFGLLDQCSALNGKIKDGFEQAVDRIEFDTHPDNFPMHLPPEIIQRLDDFADMQATLSRWTGAARAAMTQIAMTADGSLEELRRYFESFQPPAQLDQAQAAILAEMREAMEGAESLREQVEQFVQQAERRMLASFIAPFTALENQVSSKLEAITGNLASQLFGVLHATTQQTLEMARPIRAMIDHRYSKPGERPMEHQLQVLQLILAQDVQDMFLPDDAKEGIYRQLDADQHVLACLADNSEAMPIADLRKRVLIWRDRLRAIGDKPARLRDYVVPPSLPDPSKPCIRDTHETAQPPAFATAGFALAGLLDMIAKGQLEKLIDVDRLKRELLAEFVDIRLPRLSLNYSLETDLQPLAGVFSMIRDEGKQRRFGRLSDEEYPKDLTLTFTSSFAVDDPDSSQVSAKGVLQPFTINLFQVISLHFRPIVFEAGTGRETDLDVKIAEVELGSAVGWIQQLQQMLGFDDTGFFIEPRFSPPAVEVRYMLDLGTLTFGNVAFIDVALGAGVLLPFDNRPAEYSFYLGRPGQPVMISAAPYGGGFYLGITTTSRQVTSLSMSFEAGAVAAFGFGALRGQGKITTGIYISRNRTSAKVAGFFVASGSAHIACFGISTCLYVSVVQQDGGAMKGSATFTYSFSIGLKEWDFDIPVRKLIPALGGGGIGFTVMQRAQQNGLIAHDSGLFPNSDSNWRSVSAAVAMDADWEVYQEYFEDDL